MSFLLAAPWELRPPWDEPSVQREHGVYLCLPTSNLQLHVRGGRGPTLPDYPLTPNGIERYLFAQGWASPPFDVVSWREPPLVGIAGTFRMSSPDSHVREWYVTDGEFLADCCAVGPKSDIVKWLAACDAVVRSIRFDHA
jgi:hypothetical protein